MSADSDMDTEFEDELAYDDQLESVLQAAESLVEIGPSTRCDPAVLMDHIESAGTDGKEQGNDIEDVPLQFMSPFEQFRRKGWLSVSDLVGTVWCEVQYDYRLRTLPFLPPSQRPGKIVTNQGKEIGVDKAKVEGKERILKRGEKIHKRLEREIHPAEIIVTTTTREDVWGLRHAIRQYAAQYPDSYRFLNMLSALEALLTLGKCREVPVVGFVGGILVMGVIDELDRKPLDISAVSTPTTRSSRQTNLTSFFTSSSPANANPAMIERERTHKIYVSDSKTRANGTLPKEADALAGRLQCMVYKELLDAMLLSVSPEQPPGLVATGHTLRPSVTSFSFAQVFAHLDLDPCAMFSDSFFAQSRPVVIGNDLRFGADEAKNLDAMVAVWVRYVEQLGLGSGCGSTYSTSSSPKKHTWNSKRKGETKQSTDNLGRTEMRLELVYRRAAAKKENKRGNGASRKRRKRTEMPEVVNSTSRSTDAPGAPSVARQTESSDPLPTVSDDGIAVHLAIEMSLQAPHANGEFPDIDGMSTGRDATPLFDGTSTVFESTQDNTARSDTLDLARFPADAFPRPDENFISHTMRSEIYDIDRTSDEEKDEEELAWAVEMSLVDHVLEDEAGVIAVPLSQKSGSISTDAVLEESANLVDTDAEQSIDANTDSPTSPSITPQPSKSGSSGSIIGRHRFQHDLEVLERHLDSVLQYWRGVREPEGVSLAEVNRCAWCEFEEGCEWRIKKAEEAWQKMQEMRNGRRM